MGPISECISSSILRHVPSYWSYPFSIGLVLVRVGMMSRRQVGNALHVACDDWSIVVCRFCVNTEEKQMIRILWDLFCLARKLGNKFFRYFYI